MQHLKINIKKRFVSALLGAVFFVAALILYDFFIPTEVIHDKNYWGVRITIGLLMFVFYLFCDPFEQWVKNVLKKIKR